MDSNEKEGINKEGNNENFEKIDNVEIKSENSENKKEHNEQHQAEEKEKTEKTEEEEREKVEQSKKEREKVTEPELRKQKELKKERKWFKGFVKKVEKQEDKQIDDIIKKGWWAKRKEKKERKEEYKKSRENLIKQKKGVYEKYHKLFLIISLAILIFSVSYLVAFHAKHNDFALKDVTLTGGVAITIHTNMSAEQLESTLSKSNIKASTRTIKDIYTGKQSALIIESQEDADKITPILNSLGFKDFSVEMTGSSLSHSFYKQLIRALIMAFIFMSLVVFIIFRAYAPSIAVILAAITDLVGALALIDILGIKLSTAGIAAFLMLLGYSVDTDIMLTTKVIRSRNKPLNDRLKSSVKTGLTMTLTSIIAVFIAFTLVNSDVLRQIFLILTLGLVIDLISTWFGNASIIYMYAKKKRLS